MASAGRCFGARTSRSDSHTPLTRPPGILIPWRASGCCFRQSALNHVQALYQQHHPEWPVHLGECPEGPWCKALALRDALTQTDARILVIADADVFTDGLAEAVEAVERGAPWAVPHLNVVRLREDGSEDERPYRGLEGGGIVILAREAFMECPPDPRFIGWGQEDESWGAALTCLFGPPWRGTADLTHYWHPPQPRLSRSRGSREGWNLRRRYLRARHDPDEMRALIGEHLDLDATPESAVRPRSQSAV